jgi:hypothetical protein
MREALRQEAAALADRLAPSAKTACGGGGRSERTTALSSSITLSEVGFDPQSQCLVSAFLITDQDRSQLSLIARAKERRVKRNAPGQLSHVLAIDRTIPDELGEGQVVRVERG